jgi:hypothetical protein
VGRDGAGTVGRIGDKGRGGAGAVPVGPAGVDCFPAGAPAPDFSDVGLPPSGAVVCGASAAEPVFEVAVDDAAGEGVAVDSAAGFVFGGGSSARTRAPTGEPADTVWACTAGAASAEDGDVVRVLAAAASTRAASDPVAWVGAAAGLAVVAAGACGRGMETAVPPSEEVRAAAAGSALDIAVAGSSEVDVAAGAGSCDRAGGDAAGEVADPPGAVITGGRPGPRCAGPAFEGGGSGVGAGFASPVSESSPAVPEVAAGATTAAESSDAGAALSTSDGCGGTGDATVADDSVEPPVAASDLTTVAARAATPALPAATDAAAATLAAATEATAS